MGSAIYKSSPGRLIKVTVISTPGANTFTKQSITKSVLVECVGGGGGAPAISGSAPTDGGDTTFGSVLTAGGGKKGTTTAGGDGGTGTGGDINIAGGKGEVNAATVYLTAPGGRSMLGFKAALYGGGGNASANGSYGGGGGGGYCRKLITPYTDVTTTVTIGAAGAGGNSQNPGFAGVCIISEYS